MPVTISSTMPRRGRKTTLETDLDSVWGDMDITSPTNHTQMWQNNDAILELHVPYNTYLDHQKKRQAPISDPAPANPTIASKSSISSVKPRPEAEGFRNDIARMDPTRPRLSTRSHSQSRIEPRHPSIALPERITPPAEVSRISSVSSIWSEDDYFRYMAAYNANNMPNGMISPPITEFDDGPAQSCAAGPVGIHFNQDLERQVPALAQYTPPSEHSMVIVRPKPIRPFTPEEAHKDRPTHQPNLNLYALESMRSPLVTVLSPVSEVFDVNSDTGPGGEITILDDQDTPPTSFSRLSRVPQLPADMEQNLLSKYAVLTPDLHAPLSNHPTTRAMRPNHQNLPSLSIPAGASNRGKVGMGIDFGESQSAILPSTSVDFKTLVGSHSQAPPVPVRSTLRNHSGPVSAGTQSRRDTCEITSPQTKATPLAVTSCMRMQSPPMGACQPGQKTSPPMDTVTRALLHKKSPSQGEISRGRLTAPTPPALHLARHKRSASVEPVPSPSFFATAAPGQPDSMGFRGSKAQYQSISPNTLDLIVDAVMQRAEEEFKLMGLSQVAQCVRKHAAEEIKASSKQATPQVVSGPEKAHTHPVPSHVAPPDVEARYKNIPNTTFYNEVRGDFGDLSREAWPQAESIDDKKVENNTRTSLSDDRLKHRIRARSASRPRDRSTQRQPMQEFGAIAEQPQLVPTYSQIWL